MSAVLGAAPYAVIAVCLIGVVACANWEASKQIVGGWMARLQREEWQAPEPTIGDEPLNWADFPEWRELVDSGKARRLGDGPRPVDRRAA